MERRKEELSLTELISSLPGEISRLLKREVDLAKSELSAKAKEAMVDILMLVGGGVVFGLGCLILVAFVIAIISLAIPVWLSCLIVGFFLFALGGIVALIGLRRLRSTDWTPKMTIDALKEDSVWLKEQMA